MRKRAPKLKVRKRSPLAGAIAEAAALRERLIDQEEERARAERAVALASLRDFCAHIEHADAVPDQACAALAFMTAPNVIHHFSFSMGVLRRIAKSIRQLVHDV